MRYITNPTIPSYVRGIAEHVKIKAKSPTDLQIGFKGAELGINLAWNIAGVVDKPTRRNKMEELMWDLKNGAAEPTVQARIRIAIEEAYYPPDGEYFTPTGLSVIRYSVKHILVSTKAGDFLDEFVAEQDRDDMITRMRVSGVRGLDILYRDALKDLRDGDELMGEKEFGGGRERFPG